MTTCAGLVLVLVHAFTSCLLCFATENITNRHQVEIELLRLENPYGVGLDGMPCDPFVVGCDTRIYAYLDWLTPAETWPGSREIEADDTIFEAAHPTPTSFDVNKILINHICGDMKKIVTLRVRVMDEDHMYRGTDDIIGEFNCRFGVHSADQEESATWSEPQTCEPVVAQSMIWFTFRSRVFKIDGACANDTTRTEK